MKTHLNILSLFIVFSDVVMKSGNVYKGTEGQRVDIECPFPDEHKHTPKYFCRDPCTSSKHVLIKTVKIEKVVSAGRYSVIYNLHTNTFTVTIKHLKLSDSGVYYCGLDQWFKDMLIKVQISVHPAPVIPPLNTSASTLSSTHTTKHTVSTWMTTHTSDDNVSSTPTVHTSSATPRVENLVNMGVVCAGVLLLLVFCFFVALVLLCKRRSLLKSRSLNPPILGNPIVHPPNLNQTEDDVFHIYDEVTTSAHPQENDASINFSPKDDVNALYSLITLQLMQSENK